MDYKPKMDQITQQKKGLSLIKNKWRQKPCLFD